MSDLLTVVDQRPDFNRWRRKNRTLVVEVLEGENYPWPMKHLLARVHRVRKGKWRAVMMPAAKGKQFDAMNFNRMEDACLWAEARLPLYELQWLA